jgi:hypothetical protein
VVATPTLRRGAWIAAALLASGAIVAIAMHGRRPEPGLARFEPAGVMLGIRPEQVTGIEILGPGGRWWFVKTDTGGWRVSAGSPPLAADPTTSLDNGLRFLHVSAPQRTLSPDEVIGLSMAEFGLAPPRYTVSVRSSGRPFTIEFGGLNAQGLAQYARVAGEAGIVLLPRYIGQQWEAATGAP